ncbi:hypothetical protein WA158_004517 [Blastocystis sp. Blastoise]
MSTSSSTVDNHQLAGYIIEEETGIDGKNNQNSVVNGIKNSTNEVDNDSEQLRYNSLNGTWNKLKNTARSYLVSKKNNSRKSYRRNFHSMIELVTNQTMDSSINRYDFFDYPLVVENETYKYGQVVYLYTDNTAVDILETKTINNFTYPFSLPSSRPYFYNKSSSLELSIDSTGNDSYQSFSYNRDTHFSFFLLPSVTIEQLFEDVQLVVFIKTKWEELGRRLLMRKHWKQMIEEADEVDSARVYFLFGIDMNDQDNTDMRIEEEEMYNDIIICNIEDSDSNNTLKVMMALDLINISKVKIPKVLFIEDNVCINYNKLQTYMKELKSKQTFSGFPSYFDSQLTTNTYPTQMSVCFPHSFPYSTSPFMLFSGSIIPQILSIFPYMPCIYDEDTLFLGQILYYIHIPLYSIFSYQQLNTLAMDRTNYLRSLYLYPVNTLYIKTVCM